MSNITIETSKKTTITGKETKVIRTDSDNETKFEIWRTDCWVAEVTLTKEQAKEAFEALKELLK